MKTLKDYKGRKLNIMFLEYGSKCETPYAIICQFDLISQEPLIEQNTLDNVIKHSVNVFENLIIMN